ncbi:hypothetical protein F856_gp01 [Enterobacteria phage vB_EcoS_Rogue1]|uniref:Uncharacterized protein n=1 Tax=Enterobacteria phage vB_EcoS_Rogue1 TaxID=1147155 RepID=K7PMJ5_9CAUD|nr:hypothetical protein F856_gp01 [Enterobacteria phage vB_EcoS_Rogue1]AFM76553.1 hypothetical protein Rogue1_001 [Enterobacteria phage vB_EcoS_Rogue1]
MKGGLDQMVGWFYRSRRDFFYIRVVRRLPIVDRIHIYNLYAFIQSIYIKISLYIKDLDYYYYYI